MALFEWGNHEQPEGWRVIYFATPSSLAAKQAMCDGLLGFIDSPRQRSLRPDGVMWCADNSCYTDKWDEHRWWRFLVKHAGDADSCVFAAAPDVVGDHHATLSRSLPWLPKIRDLGYPAAFVAQDGATPDEMPWTQFDVLFVGGSTEFKLGPAARALIRSAKRRGMWVHVGRVNSYKRCRAMEALGVDSVDGTKLTFEPDVALPLVLSWVTRMRGEPGLEMQL